MLTYDFSLSGYEILWYFLEPKSFFSRYMSWGKDHFLFQTSVCAQTISNEYSPQNFFRWLTTKSVQSLASSENVVLWANALGCFYLVWIHFWLCFILCWHCSARPLCAQVVWHVDTFCWWLKRAVQSVPDSWSLKHKIIQRMRAYFGKTPSFLFSCFHSYSFVIAYKIKEWINFLELSSAG